MSSPQPAAECPHKIYIDITGFTNDRCNMVLRKQPINQQHPLEDRPLNTVTIPDYEDEEVASIKHYYPPEARGLTSCDALAFRLCIECHQVIGLEKKTEAEWVEVMNQKENVDDD